MSSYKGHLSRRQFVCTNITSKCTAIYCVNEYVNTTQGEFLYIKKSQTQRSRYWERPGAGEFCSHPGVGRIALVSKSISNNISWNSGERHMWTKSYWPYDTTPWQYTLNPNFSWSPRCSQSPSCDTDNLYRFWNRQANIFVSANLFVWYAKYKEFLKPFTFQKSKPQYQLIVT